MKRLVVLLFFLSGACGLVYEVVWTRLLTHVFGSTALAVGTVLAAFMTGLAIGGWALGKTADRVDRSLLLYARLEAGVAFAAAAAHVLLTQITPAYLAVYDALGKSHVALAVARFLLAFVLIVCPTVLMGATLPILARFMVRHLSAIGSSLSTLYAINTVGAVAGALAAGFVLIRVLGIHGAAITAIAGNAVVALVAWRVSARVERAPARPAPDAPAADPERRLESPSALTYRLVIAGLAVSGMASFAYEVLWTRCLHFVTGNSTYAVTTTLVAFLAGIALGGWLIRFAMRPGVDTAATFGWIQIGIALFAATAMPLLFGALDLEAIRARTWGVSGGFWPLAVSRFGIALLVMLLPAALIGATFPLAGRLGVAAVRETGAGVGRVYAINTAGNVIGALLPGLVLIHAIGIQRSILLMAALNLAVGLGVLLSRLAAVRSLRWAVPSAAFASLLVALSVPFAFRFPHAPGGAGYRVLFERDGPSATTAVVLNPDTRETSMTVDGVTIGGTGVTDYKQQLLAHLPKLLLDDVSHELSVGLGSGLLVAESARHARVARITCVEIEPTVVQGSAWFAAERRHPAGPEVRIVVDDVANHLRTTSESYDVVSADEKTADEFASNGFSYSRDYYDLIRRRMKPRGAVIQWVPTDLPPRQYRMILKTFSEAFPHVLLWHFGPALMSGTSNTILVGSTEPIVPDLDRARRWMRSDSTAFAGLSRYGLTTPEIVLAQLWTDREAIRAAVAEDPQNTLTHPRYEFYAPGDYAVPSRRRLARNFEFLMRLRKTTTDPAFLEAGAGSDDESLLRLVRSAEGEYLRACDILLHDGSPRSAMRHLERAVEIAPWNENLRARVFAQYWNLAGQYLAAGDPRAAAELDRMGLRAYDKHPMGHVEYALARARIGDVAGALASARRALALDPDLVAARSVLAELLLHVGRREEAAGHLRAILAVEPDHEAARRMLGGR